MEKGKGGGGDPPAMQAGPLVIHSGFGKDASYR